VQFLVWGAVTLVAFNKIRERKVISHSLWMVRSIAVTASFITHAWWVGLFTYGFPPATHGPHLAHNLGDWVTWIANLLIAEVVIRGIRAKYKDRYARELAVSGAK
jgi:hypothetical protein